MRPARSQEEAYLFAEWCPCECGRICDGWELTNVDVSSADATIVGLTAACPQCGRVRGISFALPARYPQPPSPHYGFPEDPPSALFDPAFWWSLSELYRQAAEESLAGVAPDAGLWTDPVRWAEQVGLLTRCATALDEVLRFLPDDAEAVPRTAFWTPQGRALSQAEPDLFTRAWLEAEWQERWGRVHAFRAAHPEPPDPQDPDEASEEGTAQSATSGTELPFARSAAEADLFVTLRPCACGESDFDPVIGMGEDAQGSLLRYTGRCVSCGHDRTFLFRQKPYTTWPSRTQWADGPEPSQLIDAGEWLWLAESLVADYPVSNGCLVAEDPEQLKDDLTMAAAAVEEVMRFLPPGADTVPDSAFWTERGRDVRALDPGRFRRYRLEAIREAYRSAAARVNAASSG
jgi:hypothetical protein